MVSKLGLLVATALGFLLCGISPAGGGEWVSKQEAINLARAKLGGSLGTWVEALNKQDHWYVSGRSKSLRPPVVYVIDARSGKIVLDCANASAVRLKGTAENSALGALLRISPNVVISLPEVVQWPPTLTGKPVAVSGVLKQVDGADTAPAANPVLEVISTKYRSLVR